MDLLSGLQRQFGRSVQKNLTSFHASAHSWLKRPSRGVQAGAKWECFASSMTLGTGQEIDHEMRFLRCTWNELSLRRSHGAQRGVYAPIDQPQYRAATADGCA